MTDPRSQMTVSMPMSVFDQQLQAVEKKALGKGQYHLIAIIHAIMRGDAPRTAVVMEDVPIHTQTQLTELLDKLEAK